MCVNDEMYQNECLYYINRLHIPQGFEIDILTIWEANSMMEGYNAAMEASDAKYKVYLHQDVFITNKEFLLNVLCIFKDESIGMIGMVGAPKLPSHGVMWFGDRVGSVYTSNIIGAELSVIGEIEDGKLQDVEVIDGLLMITQYDIPWREDIFKNWDFYDVSQSIEFRRKGYRVVVPEMEKPWCIHDDGFWNLSNYYKDRRLFLQEYVIKS